MPKIFSGSSNKLLAEKICNTLSTSLSPIDMTIFSDGEKRIRIVDRVVDEDCIVIQSTASPVDENYMELFFIVDALKRSGARSITAVIPYLGYQRQDHVFREGEAVSLSVVIKTIERLGVSKVITLDLHSIKIREEFDIEFVQLSALSLFSQKIKEESLTDTVLVSPDMGGIRRIKIISEVLDNMPYATIVKNRDLTTGKIEAERVEGKVLKKAIIVDDVISSGKTIMAAAEILKINGAEDIRVMATHAVLSENAPELLQGSIVSKVVLTDTIEIPESKQFSKLEIVSVADIIAKELATSH